MKIPTRTDIYDMLIWLPLEAEMYVYDGPLQLQDRAAQAAAKNAANTSANTAGTLGAEAQAAQGQTTPFYQREMNAEHGFTPGQTGELLTAAESGAGGSTGALEEEAKLNAGRTGNTAGYAGAHGNIAQGQTKALAGASEGIAAQDVMAAKALNQAGAAGLSETGKTDTQAMLQAMGLQNEDINTQIKAGQSGWFQNLMKGIETVSGAAKSGAEGYSAYENA